MARVQNTLIGRASGSVGEVVFLTWKLLNVTRAKPASVANPQTVLQTQQRNKFGAIVELYNILKPVVSLGLVNRNRRMSVFNFFQYLNQQNAFSNLGDGNIQFLPSLLKISYGLLQKPNPTLVQALDGFDTMTASFGASLLSGQTFNDRIILAGANLTTGEWRYNTTSWHRFNSLVGLEFATPFSTGDVYVMYIFQISAINGLVSDTLAIVKEVS